MGEDSIQEDDPVTASRQRRRLPGDADDDALPSIRINLRRSLDFLWAICVLAAAPLALALGHAFRIGRDLTTPVLVGEGIVLLTGITVAAVGFRRNNLVYLSSGLLSALLSIGCGVFGAGYYMLWVGRSNMELSFFVTDAKTGKPIEGAVIAFTNQEDARVEGKTDRQGNLLLSQTFKSIGSSSFVCETAGVSFSETRIFVAAMGFDSIEMPLRKIAGHGRDLHSPARPISVALTPK
jgi:hypothetical protein